jgi:hypothetical protein
MKYPRKSGSIIAADFNLNARSEREFVNALVTEIGIPACDGASKDPAYMTLKFAPEYTRYKKASGKVSGTVTDNNDAKSFLPSNFHLSIDGVDTSGVTRVDGLSVKRTPTDPQTQDPFKEPGKLEFPNIKITVSEEYAQPFYDWHEDFVVRGNNGDKMERSGRLEYYAKDGTPLLTLYFRGLGIFKIDSGSSNNEDKIASVTAEMYCENITSKFA